MYWSRVCIAVGTVLAAVATVLSLLVWGGDASMDVGLILSCGFGGASLIGLGVLLR